MPKNPRAFPNKCANDDHDGMTLRDWFAGQALAMSQPDRADYLADWAYRVADAMLAERAKGAA